MWRATLRLLLKENILLNKCVVVLLASSALMSNVQADTNSTIDSLKKKNAELIELKADLAIAQTKDALNKLKQPAVATNSGFTGVANFKAPKPSPTADIEGVQLVGAGGDPSSPVGSFVVGGSSINRRPGESINGWMLIRLTTNEATFSKAGKSPSEKFEKTIYRSAFNPLNQNRAVQVTPQVNQGLYVPAVQPPIR
jgi:hypothetical protein